MKYIANWFIAINGYVIGWYPAAKQVAPIKLEKTHVKCNGIFYGSVYAVENKPSYLSYYLSWWAYTVS